MASPLIIDVHMHIFESKAKGRQAKAGYPGWEFGEGAPLPPYSAYHGDVEDAAASLAEAGALWAVTRHVWRHTSRSDPARWRRFRPIHAARKLTWAVDCSCIGQNNGS